MTPKQNSEKDVTDLTFKAPIVVAIVFGAISMTISIIGAYFAIGNRFTRLESKFDIFIAGHIANKEIIINEMASIKEQVNNNTFAIKTMAEFIKPENIELKKYK